MQSYKTEFVSFIRQLQDDICGKLEQEDGKATFLVDKWSREGGGGGETRVISDGHVFEKGGVNISAVHGELPESLARHLNVKKSRFFACGLSLVIHPFSPHVPTVHANYRYFELYDEDDSLADQWFGGGADLTPYYLYREDAVHFHKTQKEACDAFDKKLYPRLKKACDEYFYNSHRSEARGVGGLFFDYLRPDEDGDCSTWYHFTKKAGQSFLDSYLPIVQKRKGQVFSTSQKEWQEIRRGRYVEFNLIHDRGTLFGLKTKGRIESILMSLPKTVRWEYDHHPAPGSPEAELVEVLKNPVDWV